MNLRQNLIPISPEQWSRVFILTFVRENFIREAIAGATPSPPSKISVQTMMVSLQKSLPK
jgi:hypothetical protein